MEESQNWRLRTSIIASVIALIVIWTIVVLTSGSGLNITGIDWNFERTGQLGDSFGVISSIMAAVAAYFAFQTYRAAREDIARLERRSAEPSYLNLLERRYDVLDRVRSSRIKIAGPDTKILITHGQVVIDNVASILRRSSELSGHTKMQQEYSDITNPVFGLASLYRFTYHIIAFADRQFATTPPASPMQKSDPAYQYIRLLRAQMSDTELLLFSLNCVYGKGREKFKPLAERYALFHNMNPNDIEIFSLRELLEPTAFGIKDKDCIVSEITVAVRAPF